MAGTWGYALSGFASGLSSGFAMGMEKSKIDALKKEQKRLEEAQEKAKKVFQEWYDSPGTKEFCANLDTASQGERAYFISGIRRISEDVFKYFTEIDNDIREGNIAAAKSKNDLLEQKIKSATDLAALGMTAVFPDGSPMTIPPEDIEFQKQIQIGKMAGGPTGEAMGKEMWRGRGLGEITPTPLEKMGETAKKLDYAYATGNASYFNRIAKSLGVDTTFETYKKEFEKPEVTPEGEITAGRKRAIDVEKDYRETSKEILYGERDYMGMPISIGIIPMDMQMNIAMGKELTNEEKQTISNNYNLRKETFNESVKKYVESILNQLGVLGITAPTPKVTPEVKVTPEKTGIIKSIVDWWQGTPPTPTIPLGEKGALISTMTDQELKDKMKETDSTSEEYKLLEEEAKQRGLIEGDYWTEKYGF